MKTALSDFALIGGDRAFGTDLPVAQLYFPGWERYEAAMRGIFERQYYTNHGPLIGELEANLEEFLGVRNAVTVTNATIGLYLVALGLGLKGKILMPAFTFIATAQAAVLAGLEPVLCDVDPETHQITPETAERAMADGVGSIVPVNLWGGSCDVPAFGEWADAHGLALYFDSAHGFGAERADGKLGRLGRAEVFSFHAAKIMSSAEGGCVCTDDDDLAERIRNMRSNYGIRQRVDVPLIVNARMSEAQAAIGLCNLEDFDANRSNNEAISSAYRAALAGIPGVRVIAPSNVVRGNSQYVVVQIDARELGLSRNQLHTVLRSEGVRARRYFMPGVHRSPPFDEWYPQYVDALPVTDMLCETVLQLPCGALVTPDEATDVASLIAAAHEFADGLARA